MVNCKAELENTIRRLYLWPSLQHDKLKHSRPSAAHTQKKNRRDLRRQQRPSDFE
jgi:hypothetical protein